MNANMTAYARPAAPTRTPRAVEYDLFAQVTRRLKQASAVPGAPFAALAEAIADNMRLWTVIAADVAESANGLPPPLRARLFYLAEFTRHHSRRILSGDAGPDVLIDINTAVMRGLRGEGEPG